MFSFFYFLHYKFHLQIVERNVANTTLASRTVIGEDRRHGFLLLLRDAREQYNGTPKKADFEKQRKIFQFPE